ncbi:helix-turn-helix domain-containing protein [Streptomyces sp. NPDC041003]|uniref:helix-turn-helix domain-containing protein n=1 Tax=Streptomyces sp. NPDC041003 TaxID=3155730 RepID=UPI0033FB58AA
MFEQPGFGKRLRQLRKRQGVSQVDLTGPGMSAAYLSRLESGDRRPTERAVLYLTQRLGVSVDAFEDRPEDSLIDIVAAVSAIPERELDAETGKLLADALKAAGDADSMARWHALTQLAQVHEVLGDFTEERTVLDQLGALSEELGRPALQFRARIRLARCARNLGDVKAARQAVREAIALSERHNLRISVTDLLRSELLLVSAEAELGDLAEAARLSEKVCASLPAVSGPLAAEAFWTAATVSTRQGNHVRAAEHLARALPAIDSRDDLMLWIRLRLAAASLSLQATPPQLDAAESYLASAQPALELIGTARHQQEMLFLQAKLAFHQGRLDQAQAFVTAGAEGRSLLLYRDQIRLDVLKGLLAIRAGDPDAFDGLKALAAQVQSANMPDLAAEVWRTVAEGAQ